MLLKWQKWADVGRSVVLSVGFARRDEKLSWFSFAILVILKKEEEIIFCHL